MVNKIIESCKTEHLPQLQAISKQCFLETFAKYNTTENLNYYLQNNYSLNQLLQELQNKGSFFYFFKYDNQLVAYLKINICPDQSDFNYEDTLEIERIYVLTEYKGKGIGKELMDFAIHKAIEFNLKKIWLGVWENNKPALKFYDKLGFYKINEHIFKLGNDNQTDYILQKDLIALP